MLPRKYFEAFLVALACVAALYLGSHIVVLPPAWLGLVSAFIFILVWAFFAGDYWWTPMLAGATILGVFGLGFKIYPTEVALALCLVGLAPLLLARHDQIFQRQRRPLPLVFYLAALYISVRLLVDIVPAHESKGTLFRILFNAEWPFVFGWLFHNYGKTSAARMALGLAFVLLLVRSAAAVAGYFITTPLYIPGINYVLSFSDTGSMVSMRYVAFSLVLVSLILFHASRSLLAKAAVWPVIGAGAVLLVMGESRLMTLMLMILPACFFVWRRNWIFSGLGALFGIGSIVYINLHPTSVEDLPPVMERAVAGLILKPDMVAAQSIADSSNTWHDDLRKEAYARWTGNSLTFLFGFGIRPSPDLSETKAFSVDRPALVSIASNVASYESGLWTVLACLGSIGLVLYALLFLHLWRQVLPYFLRHPRGTLWEGFLFWGCFASVIWWVMSDFMGTFPGLEIVMMIIAADIIQDKRMERDTSPSWLASLPPARQPEYA